MDWRIKTLIVFFIVWILFCSVLFYNSRGSYQEISKILKNWSNILNDSFEEEPTMECWLGGEVIDCNDLKIIERRTGYEG